MIKYCCPVCNKSDNSKIFLKETYDFSKIEDLDFAARPMPNHAHFAYKRCNECGALFVESALTPDELDIIYKNSSFDEKEEGCQASETYAYYTKKKITNHKGKAMDIGASEGSFLLELLKLGYEDVSGVEPTKAAIEKADPLIKDKLINSMFNADDFPKNEYDLISFFQVIEHVSNPTEVLSGIHELLREDGRIIIVCHNYRSLINRIMRGKSPIYNLEHLQIFSKKPIIKLLEKCGYSDIHTFRVTNKYALSYWVRLLPMPMRLKKITLSVLKKIRMDKIKIGIPGSNMGAVAKK